MNPLVWACVYSPYPTGYLVSLSLQNNFKFIDNTNSTGTIKLECHHERKDVWH
jgi:hypothetical protein